MKAMTANRILKENMGLFYRDEIETTTRKLELEQRRLHKLNKDLATADSEYSQKRGHVQKKKHGADTVRQVADNAAEGTQKAGPSQDGGARTRNQEVRQLEKKLEKAIGDLNQSTHENEQLMKQIDQLRKERQVLDTVFQGMTRNIARRRAEGDKLRTQIQTEAQASEDAKQKQNALGKRLKGERDNFNKERIKLQTSVHAQNQLKKDLGYNSGPERPRRGQTESKNLTGKGKDGGSHTIADEEEEFSERAMHRRILKLSFLNTIQRRHIKQHRKNIEVFEQAFATIKSSTQIHEIDEIVRIFVELEQRNFSLLTYVNQLNREIEAIDIRKRELQTALDTHEQNDVNSKNRKEVLLKGIEAQIARTKQAVTEKDKMIEDATKALKDCRSPILRTVMFLKKELPKLAKSVPKAGYQGKGPTRMKQLPPHEDSEQVNHQLAYIEEAILQFRACLGESAMPGRARPMPAPKGNPPHGHKKPMELPSAQNINDDSDEEGDPTQPGLGDRPMDLQELRRRALEKEMSKRKKQKSSRQAHAQDQADEEELDAPPPRGQKRETTMQPLSGGDDLAKSPRRLPHEAAREEPASKELWWSDTMETGEES